MNDKNDSNDKSALARITTITLKGISHTLYDFEIHPWDTAFSGFSAVYAVLKRGAHGYNVIYVSHTCNVSDCIKEHEFKSALDAAGGTHIGVRIETRASRRLSIQADLVASYTPVCNCNVAAIKDERPIHLVKTEQTGIKEIVAMA